MSTAAKDMISRQQELPTIEPARAATPMDLLQAAVSTGVDAAQLEKLMDLQERWQANEARRAFAESLAAFQSEVPIIYKNKQGDKSTYAAFEYVIKTIKPYMHKHGFSSRFDCELISSETDGTPLVMTATCYITHTAGHTESNHFSCPVDAGPTNRQGQRVMNSAQSTASARSYAKRYALGDALGLAFGDEDDDGKGAGNAVELIDDHQLIELQDEIDSIGENWTSEDQTALLGYLKVSDLAELRADRFNAAKNAIKSKKKKVAK